MLEYEAKELNKVLQGKTIANVNLSDTELLIETTDNIVLQITGGYCKEVYTDLLTKQVTYEKYKAK